MSQELYSIEQIAERLHLHVRTVRNYVRTGKLKATRIGKQYRVTREDLDAFTGLTSGAETLRRTRCVEVSSVVQIDAIGPEEASRITNGIVGAAKARVGREASLRVDSIYDKERGRLKIVVIGGLADTASVLQLVGLYQEQP